jgi:hypothetical protein
MTQDVLPAYEVTPIGFEHQEICLRGAKGAQYLRILNLDWTTDYLHISDPTDERKEMHFRLKDDLTAPILFSVDRIDAAPTFVIRDHRLSKKLIFTRTTYFSGEKYEFTFRDAKFAWKQDGDDLTLINYPEKKEIARVTRMNKVRKFMSSPIGNYMKFTPVDLGSDPSFYHFAWLTAFCLNWELCKLNGTIPA